MSIIDYTHIAILSLFSYGIFAQNEVIPLWENGVPDAIIAKDYIEEFTYDQQNAIKGVNNVSKPTLTIFLADEKKSNGTSVVICPGGGYSHLAINKEGYKVAKWLNTLGVSAFVLKYRMPTDKTMKDKSIGPLQDAQQAIRIVRRNAIKWNIDTNKIGIMGFSAGGHLAATLSTHYNDKVYEASDTISARPDLAILIYPVISMEEGITHKGSKNNLLGETSTPQLIEKFSIEKHVDKNTPPTFIVHATNDKAVPVENSIQYYLALKKNKVSVEMHLYEVGGHGFGLGVKSTSKHWPKDCENWLLKK